MGVGGGGEGEEAQLLKKVLIFFLSKDNSLYTHAHTHKRANMHAQHKEGEGVAERTRPYYSQQMRKIVPISQSTLYNNHYFF